MSYDVSGSDVVKVIRKLFNCVGDAGLEKDLYIIGEDADKCETIFKQGAFNKVIKLKVRTTETKLLDHQSVLEALIQETT